MPTVRVASLACALLGATGCCLAADVEELSEREFLTNFPPMLSASRLRQDASETPQAVTVIDQETIKASGAREFAELFRLVPGFTVTYVTYVKGLQPIVTYHGLGREFFSRLQVLIDGRSMNNATLGGIDWNDFPVAFDDIERIEVVRGPSNASHGIGAFLATINFITRHASQARGAAANVNAGSDGILDGDVRFGGHAGTLDYRVTAGHRADDGFGNLPDRRRRDYTNVRADWQITPADSLLLEGGATEGVNGVGIGTPVDPSRTARTSTEFAQAKWERNVDADNGLSVQFYYYHFTLSDRFLTDALPQFNNERFTLDGGSAVRRADLEMQQTGSASPMLRWVWGGSVREDLVDVGQQFFATPRLRIQRLFGHLEWRPVSALIVNAGAMIEHNNLSGTDVAPQFALNYSIAPNQVIRVGISRALRTPTLIESAVQRVIIAPGGPASVVSDELRPETIVSREIGYVGEWPQWHATLDVKMFFDNVRELIGLIGVQNEFPPTAFPNNARNGDSAVQRGVEGQLTWRPAQGSSLVAAVTHIEIRSADILDTYSSSAPRNTVHILASHRFADTVDASVSFHHQGGYRISTSSDPQPTFSRVDIRVAKSFMLGGAHCEVAGVVENLLDRRYTDFRLDDVARRRAWLTFRARL